MSGAKKLLPCPFCGGDDGVSARDFKTAISTLWYVACAQCGAEGPCLSNEHIAVASWNLRAAPSLVTSSPVSPSVQESEPQGYVECCECHARLKAGSPASRIGFCSGCLGLISEGRFAEAVAAASRAPSLGSLPVEERDLLEEAAKVADAHLKLAAESVHYDGPYELGFAAAAERIAADIRALRVTSGEGTT